MSDAAWRRIAGIEGVYIGRNFNSVLNGRHCYKAIVNEAVTAANVNITDSAFNDVTSDYIDTANVTTLIPGTTITFKSPIYKLTSSDGSFIFVLDGEDATGLLLLNTYPATAAYSLRLLDNSYTGSAIRVRRASDNAEQDIGFSGSDLDTASLTSFCTGTDGFVTTWYDQSGNLNDATQATAASQPQIVSSGSVILDTAKPCVDFLTNGGTRNLRADALKDLPLASFSFFHVRRTHTVTSNTPALTWEGTDDLAFFPYATSGTTGSRIFWRDLGSATEAGSGDISNTRFLFAFNYSSTANNYKLYRNTATVVDVSTSGTAGPFSFFEIDGNVVSGGASYGNKMQELILFPSDQSANRTAIESNINDYYSIYP